MLTAKEAQDRADNLVQQAIKAGADAADAVYYCDASTSVSMRLGKLEDVSRSEGQDIGLRVFVGKRSATTSSSSMDSDSMANMVARCIAMAKEAPEDKYAGLAAKELLLKDAPIDVESDDGANPEPAMLREMALLAEEAARSVSGVENSEGAGASAGRSIFALATSNGFIGSRVASGYNLSASVIAGTGDNMERDYAWRSARHLSDLEDAETLGRRAGERAVAKLNPKNFKGGAMPVFFDPRVGGSLIGHLIGAMSGASIARKTSFLLEFLGEEIFAPQINIIEQPHLKRGLSSRAFDSEGLPTKSAKLIDNGRLTGWLMNVSDAAQLNLAPTGHASRGVSGSPGTSVSNVTLNSSSTSVADLMADVKMGVLITELVGQGVNPVTGDYSRGANGFLIENGVISHPISEFTIAGNLKDMFRQMMVADDLEMIRSLNVPTIRVDGMTVATG
ncbi:modulator protein [Sphingorhabdus lutea]|uniref:Modulator protein n=1 Tax=Sphingorhabdus lutea TaxID=1913578 RepID=A0A1L3J927_9SPHN|nr:metallopeptidase TldD-related protein [Sphingorhabdus lutea]APG61625.1 modulator protein [Sphingorhabdus lutea]